MLEGFLPISLEEMDSVKLMDRVDRKYVFHESKLEDLLLPLQSTYKMLDIGDKRLMEYRSLYYDTENFLLYRRHHSGYSSRFKVRFREYVETGEVFLEIKHRNNKGRTSKIRMRQPQLLENLDTGSRDFLSEGIPELHEELIPSLWVCFNRFTLVNTSMVERVTIDTNLRLRHKDRLHQFPGLVIAESKQEGNSVSAFEKHMHNQHLNTDSISKYCIGLASTNETLKHNLFKNKLLRINKIIDEHILATGG